MPIPRNRFSNMKPGDHYELLDGRTMIFKGVIPLDRSQVPGYLWENPLHQLKRACGSGEPWCQDHYYHAVFTFS